MIKREWFDVVDALSSKLSVFRYWDTVYQKKSASDYSVGVKYGIDRDGRLNYSPSIASSLACFILSSASRRDSPRVRITRLNCAR